MTGDLTFSAADAHYALRSGDAVFTRPWLRHCLGDPYLSRSRAFWMVLDVGVRRPGQAWRWPWWIVLTRAERLELAALADRMAVHVWRADDELQRCFHRIGQLVQTDCGGSVASRLALAINEALLSLLTVLRGQQGGPPQGEDRRDERSGFPEDASPCRGSWPGTGRSKSWPPAAG